MPESPPEQAEAVEGKYRDKENGQEQWAVEAQLYLIAQFRFWRGFFLEYQLRGRGLGDRVDQWRY